MLKQIILIVDDDLAIRNTLNDVLLQAGYAVALAKNGREALDLMKALPVSLVLSDLNMPFMNGGTLIEMIRNNPHQANVPFILMSTLLQDAKRVPADAFLTKPFNIAELLSTLEQVLDDRPPQ